MRRGDLADLTAFLVVADHLNFRAAASHLAVTPSALSHAMRQLEERLGVRLLHRTTRSVALTDAGARLLERLRPALGEIEGALDNLDRERQPFGQLRIYVSNFAARAVVAPIWERFLEAYPDLHLELEVNDGPADIVAKGFDAGIGHRDGAAADMVATRVMGPMRVAVVGSPAYFARRPQPCVPEDLASHNCIQYRLATDGTVFSWPFERDGKAYKAAVSGRLTVNCPDMAIRAAINGLGLAYTLDSLVEPFLHAGQLIRVLEDWSPAFEGIFLYYPGHRQVPAALRALIDMIRTSDPRVPDGGGDRNPFARSDQFRS